MNTEHKEETTALGVPRRSGRLPAAWRVRQRDCACWYYKDVILAAHQRACDVLRAGPGDFPVRLTLALQDFQAAEGGEVKMVEYRRDMADIYLEQLRDDDFVGVQNCGRMVIGPEGRVEPAAGAEINQMGEEFYPQGLGGTIRLASHVAGVPVYL